ncbi:hypothetical protein [Rhizobium sp.]|uniref:hypothetical protein n=1 Tax=Rhizobium sp. TaxID=391 RepID=UPI00289CA229
MGSDGLRIPFTATTIGEQMPFFLVTHRSLVEADSEQDAAVKALGKIEGDRKLEFEVKFDEATITRVFVERASAGLASPPSGICLVDHKLEQIPAPQNIDEVENLTASSLPAVTLERPSARTSAMVSMFLGGLVVAAFLLGAL